MRGKGRTAQITAEHEVEDKETVLVVLESIAEIDDERMVDLGDGLGGGERKPCGGVGTSSRSLRS